MTEYFAITDNYRKRTLHSSAIGVPFLYTNNAAKRLSRLCRKVWKYREISMKVLFSPVSRSEACCVSKSIARVKLLGSVPFEEHTEPWVIINSKTPCIQWRKIYSVDVKLECAWSFFLKKRVNLLSEACVTLTQRNVAGQKDCEPWGQERKSLQFDDVRGVILTQFQNHSARLVRTKISCVI